MRSLLALIAAAIAFAIASTALPATASLQSGMTVSGGDLPYPIELSVVDAEAFARRINDPPEFDELPAVSGPTYILTTPYWSTVELDRDDDEDDSPLANEAVYYQDNGFVEARQGDTPVWLVINPRQRAIVDRYIRLGEQGLLSAAPSTLEVLAQAAASEQITVEVGGRTLTSPETDEFWSLVADLPVTDLDPVQPPVRTGDSYWLVLTLREGRSVQLLHDPFRRALIDHEGSESYGVSATLADLLAATRGEPAAIDHEAGAGSPLWWFVMAGGGVIALLLSVALHRRFGAKPV